MTRSDVSNTFASAQPGALTNGTTYGLTALASGARRKQRVSDCSSVVCTDDPTAPTAATITSVTDDVAPVTGTLSSGARTNDPDLTVKVSLEIGRASCRERV